MPRDHDAKRAAAARLPSESASDTVGLSEGARPCRSCGGRNQEPEVAQQCAAADIGVQQSAGSARARRATRYMRSAIPERSRIRRAARTAGSRSPFSSSCPGNRGGGVQNATPNASCAARRRQHTAPIASRSASADHATSVMPTEIMLIARRLRQTHRRVMPRVSCPQLVVESSCAVRGPYARSTRAGRPCSSATTRNTRRADAKKGKARDPERLRYFNGVPGVCAVARAPRFVVGEPPMRSSAERSEDR